MTIIYLRRKFENLNMKYLVKSYVFIRIRSSKIREK
jgi:hypothetical protein